MAKSTLQRLLDSGLQVAEMSRQQAESVVRQLVKAGEVQRRDAEELVQRLMDLGRETTGRLAEQVENDLVRRIRKLTNRLDDLEGRVESVVQEVRDVTDRGTPENEAGEGSGSAASGGGGDSGKASGKGDGGKRAGKKSAKSGAKSSATKGSATKGSAVTAPRRRPENAPAVGVSGVRRIPTTRTARDAG